MSGTFIAVLFWCSLAVICQGKGDIHWGYGKHIGPDEWHKYFGNCGGKKQSPINIIESSTIYKKLGRPVFHGYKRASSSFTLLNNGHALQVNGRFENHFLYGSGLGGKFKPVQFHFHWGKTNARGSEHLINSKAFPLEMHIVHQNMKYKDIGQALKHWNGLAVVGVFFKIGKHNVAMQRLIKHFGKVRRPGSSLKIRSFPLDDLLPDSTEDFFRYYGSLTTPPCSEAVIWTLMEETVEISSRQMSYFRQTLDSSAHKLYDNFRPVQSVNRRVYRSFK